MVLSILDQSHPHLVRKLVPEAVPSDNRSVQAIENPLEIVLRTNGLDQGAFRIGGMIIVMLSVREDVPEGVPGLVRSTRSPELGKQTLEAFEEQPVIAVSQHGDAMLVVPEHCHASERVSTACRSHFFDEFEGTSVDR